MKYKVGDKVIIKSWEEMYETYGGTSSLYKCDDDKIYCFLEFMGNMEKIANDNNRILTIDEIKCAGINPIYLMKECSYKWSWSNDMISRRVNTDYISEETDRFYLLDFE